MAIVTYEPLNILNEINSLIGNVFPRGQEGASNTQVEASHWLPAVDIKEVAKGYVIHADLPGVDPKHIEIAMENNNLIIKGNKEDIKKEDHGQYYCIERKKGSFYRRFSLPDNVDSEAIEAKTKNGELEIFIPKKQAAPSKRIEVKLDK